MSDIDDLFETYVSVKGHVNEFATILDAPVADVFGDNDVKARLAAVLGCGEARFAIFTYSSNPLYAHILTTDVGDEDGLAVLLSRLGIPESHIAVATDEAGEPLRDLSALREAVRGLKSRTRH